MSRETGPRYAGEACQSGRMGRSCQPKAGRPRAEKLIKHVLRLYNLQ
jgi:hypothetical protein